MTPTSKKRKSALLQNLVKDKILKAFPHLKKKDVSTASTGQNGIPRYARLIQYMQLFCSLFIIRI